MQALVAVSRVRAPDQSVRPQTRDDRDRCGTDSIAIPDLLRFSKEDLLPVDREVQFSDLKAFRTWLSSNHGPQAEAREAIDFNRDLANLRMWPRFVRRFAPPALAGPWAEPGMAGPYSVASEGVVGSILLLLDLQVAAAGFPSSSGPVYGADVGTIAHRVNAETLPATSAQQTNEWSKDELGNIAAYAASRVIETPGESLIDRISDRANKNPFVVATIISYPSRRPYRPGVAVFILTPGDGGKFVIELRVAHSGSIYQEMQPSCVVIGTMKGKI